MEAVAYVVAVGAAAVAVAAAYDPRVAEWLASVLIARAEAVKVGRKVYSLARGSELRLAAREADE